MPILVTPTSPAMLISPGLVYAKEIGGTLVIEPVVLGPYVQQPVKAQTAWVVAGTVPPPVVVSAGWLPLVQVQKQPADTTEKWCVSNIPNLDTKIDGTLITRTINPTAIKETLQITYSAAVAPPGTEQEQQNLIVVPPGPVLDASGNEIRIAPWWFKSDDACPGSNPGVVLSVPPSTTPGITYKRTAVLVLANW